MRLTAILICDITKITNKASAPQSYKNVLKAIANVFFYIYFSVLPHKSMNHKSECSLDAEVPRLYNVLLQGCYLHVGSITQR